MSQLALPLKLADHAVFESYFAGGNDSVVAYLLDMLASGKGPGCWIWGGPALGKTHLLQAVCARAGDDSVYLPLPEFSAAEPDILDGLAQRRIVCLDDLQAIAADDRWELALFDMWNQLADSGGMLVIAAAATPRMSGLKLADLQSRLTRLPVFHLQPLDDAGRMQALQLRASHRGLELPDKTAAYILKRSKRDMASLYEQLDTLDSEALKAQRKLSIPFVRDVLNLL